MGHFATYFAVNYKNLFSFWQGDKVKLLDEVSLKLKTANQGKTKSGGGVTDTSPASRVPGAFRCSISLNRLASSKIPSGIFRVVGFVVVPR